jgi:hypothetical protein
VGRGGVAPKMPDALPNMVGHSRRVNEVLAIGPLVQYREFRRRADHFQDEGGVFVHEVFIFGIRISAALIAQKGLDQLADGVDQFGGHG